MRMRTLLRTTTLALTVALSGIGCASATGENEVVGEPWKMHVIDSTSHGADGVRLADFDSDGLLDIVTAWEEGGCIRIYRNPGPTHVHEPWPSVTVGAVDSPEDAFFVDLDNDGNLDVVSLTEGSDRTVYVHWAPSDPAQYLTADAWQTEPVPDSRGRMQWMFGFPLALRDTTAIDVMLTAKNTGAELGWYEVADVPRDLAAWKWHTITPVGWAMTIMPVDMNGDGRSISCSPTERTFRWIPYSFARSDGWRTPVPTQI
ncbi:MAG TPA: VCBS repeat-containing protein [Firmicutes bacterium]|nr:VCBS repeat-containing protein [Bacillota bacterium]